MEVIIKGKNSDVPKELAAYTERKLNKLTKLSRRLQTVRVSFIKNASKKRNRAFRVEMVLKGPGQAMRAEEDEASFQVAVDSAVDKLRRQLKKLKTKRVDKQREQAARQLTVIAALPPVIADEPEEAPAPAIHIMKYSIKPMSTAEAIMQLDVSGGEMMLFVSESQTVQCIRRRPDGGYALFVPDGETA